MSWLGVNLNTSLSSIKGQISSFTRDVLAEEDKIRDDDIQIHLPKKSIEEYEASIYMYQEESKELKHSRAEAEERLRAAEYHSFQKISSLEKQLNETLDELRQVKESSGGWIDVKWEADKDGDHHSVEYYKVQEAVYAEKLGLLQRQLEEERDSHKEGVFALQSAHRDDITRISSQGTLSALASRPHDSHDGSEGGDNADEEKDARMSQLEEEVNSLKSRVGALAQEKDQLSDSLVDLDTQHQLIIEEILRSKKQLTKDLQKAQEEILKLNEARATSEVTTRAQHEGLDRATEEEQAGRINDTAAQLAERAERAEAEVGRLSALAAWMEEQRRRDIPRLEAELGRLTKREEALQYENETLQKRLLSQEEECNQGRQGLRGLKDTAASQNEDILKLEAVLEAKDDEHAAICRKLKQHEEMTLLTMHELQGQKQSLESKVSQLEQRKWVEGAAPPVDDSQGKFDAVVGDLLAICAVEDPKELPQLVASLNSEVASLRCERDRWSEDLASTMHQLRESQELVETIEAEKTYLERDSEDLRDQLEELQCGERPPPEGSLTPRSLPTIEEEDVDSSVLQADEVAAEVDARGSKEAADEGGAAQLHERIEHLSSQLSAVSEAKSGLEAELATLKEENGELQKKLGGGGGHLPRSDPPLQAEMQRQALQEEEKAKLERQIAQMKNAMDKMHFDSAHLSSREEAHQSERAALRNQISAHNKTIHDYFHEIARLKTLLSESSNAAALAKECQGKLSTMEAELDKVKGLVIYKDDQIDQLTLEIQQIGEIFELSGIDRQRMYLHVKQEHFKLKSRLTRAEDELEAAKYENEELKDEEEELVSKLRSDLQAANDQLTEAKGALQTLNEACGILKEKEKELSGERQTLLAELEKASSEKAVLAQTIEAHRQKSTEAQLALDAKVEDVAKLEERFMHQENEYRDKIAALQDTLSLKAQEIETFINLTNANSSELERWKDDHLEAGQKELSRAVSDAAKESRELRSKMAQLENERQQMITASTQKHQEAVAYYQQIQALGDLLQKKTADFESVNERLSLATEEQNRATEESRLLRQNLNSVQSDSVPKIQATKLQDEISRTADALRQASEERSRHQEACKNVTKERDQLRLANSSFNSQYEEKRRETASLQERERHLSQEMQRLKQHLVDIEETYTNEAVKSEERETALRLSLARMHEKIASHSTHYSTVNQKNSVQLDSLQTKLQDAVHQRDEAKLQLHASEEASLQHQEAVTRLQQVLQDFQKHQARDISMATERERRRFENEKEKTAEIEHQLKEMKGKLDDSELGAAASASLRQELQSKEDNVIGLKTQVHAIQLAAKRSQDQVALLQSSADGKVDKHLLRNLVVGYFATPSDKQPEVLRVVAQVLDFSPEERARTGIDQQPGSWLNSIANFLAPPPSNIRIASKVDLLDHSSLSQAFIRFLEEESSPRMQPRLPAVQMAEEAKQKAQKKAHTKATGAATTPLQATGAASSASGATETPNPLLLYSAAALPEDFPVISTPAASADALIAGLPGATPTLSTPKFLNNLLNSKEKQTATRNEAEEQRD